MLLFITVEHGQTSALSEFVVDSGSSRDRGGDRENGGRLQEPHTSTQQEPANALTCTQTVLTAAALAHLEGTMTGIEEVQEDTTMTEATAADTTTMTAEGEMDVTEITETTETVTTEIEEIEIGIMTDGTEGTTATGTTVETVTETEMTDEATDVEEVVVDMVVIEMMTVVVERTEVSKYSALAMQTDHPLQKALSQSRRESVYALGGISKLLDLRISLLCRQR